jgi:hypothetical protein
MLKKVVPCLDVPLQAVQNLSEDVGINEDWVCSDTVERGSKEMDNKNLYSSPLLYTQLQHLNLVVGVGFVIALKDPVVPLSVQFQLERLPPRIPLPPGDFEMECAVLQLYLRCQEL